MEGRDRQTDRQRGGEERERERERGGGGGREGRMKGRRERGRPLTLSPLISPIVRPGSPFCPLFPGEP